MNIRASRLAFAIVLLPVLAQAQTQTVNGTAEWTVTRGTNTSDARPFDNHAFWQRYTVGYLFPILDPRLLKCDAEFTARTSSLSFGGQESSQQGSQRGIGYKLGAAAFAKTRFPFFIQASRDTVGESGDYPSSSGIRGGIVVPNGSPLPDFQTVNTALNMGWQLNLPSPSAPRVELGYRTGGSVMTGGPFRAEQHDSDLHAGVFLQATRLHHALRYQRTSFENLISQAFNQRLDDLNYELGAPLGARSHLTVRSGRRGTFSLFDVPSQLVDPGTGSYRPPSRGEVNDVYVISDVNYEPGRRVSININASADRQDATEATTNAKLASLSAQYEIFRGLALAATGVYGTRGQILADVPTTVVTRNGQVGTTYRAGVRWLSGTVAYTRGMGTSRTPDGRPGEVRSWSEQANLSSSLRWFTMAGGYDRARSRDDLLDFGNFDSERSHASVTRESRAVSLSGSWENSLVQRGRDLTFARYRQQTFTASASYRLWRQSRIAATAGGFNNRSEVGRDRTLFYGGAFDAELRRSLRLSTWLRRERTEATQTHLDQQSLNGLAQLEYRLRAFGFSLEYRLYGQDLRYQQLLEPFTFRGHQLMLRISRKFGLSW